MNLLWKISAHIVNWNLSGCRLIIHPGLSLLDFFLYWSYLVLWKLFLWKLLYWKTNTFVLESTKCSGLALFYELPLVSQFCLLWSANLAKGDSNSVGTMCHHLLSLFWCTLNRNLNHVPTYNANLIILFLTSNFVFRQFSIDSQLMS